MTGQYETVNGLSTDVTDGHRTIEENDVRAPKRAKTVGPGDQQTYAIIGAAMEVHGTLGHGFLEPVYQEALAREFAVRSVPFVRECDVAISYKGALVSCTYRADFICYDEVIVELKALGRLTTVEQSQLLNYLKATGLKRGLLINFGASRLEYKRLVF